MKNPIEAPLISRKLLKNPNYSTVFFSVLPEEFWTILTVEVNKNLARLKPSKKNPIKIATSGELIRFYGILIFFIIKFEALWILIESTYGNNSGTLRKHFAQINQTYGSVKKLGQRRFEQLHSAFSPSIEAFNSLINIFSEAMKRYNIFICLKNLEIYQIFQLQLLMNISMHMPLLLPLRKKLNLMENLFQLFLFLANLTLMV